MSLPPEESGVSTYKQIEGSLRRQLADGHWPLGSMLPSRRELAKQYGVSPITIERAISPLLTEGLLRADDRRGTFVARPLSILDPDITLPAPDAALLQDSRAVVHTGRLASRREAAQATIGIVASLYVFNQDHLALNNFWVRLLVQALEQTCAEHGHRTHFFNRVQAPGQPLLPLRASLEAALSEEVDALALIGFGLAPAEVDASLAGLESSGVPMVCITSGELRRPVPHVFFDNRSAGYDAAQHLLSKGVGELVYLAPFTTSWVEERWEGIAAAGEYTGRRAEALRRYPLAAPAWVQEEDPRALGYQAAHALFAEGKIAEGVICANDGVALGLLDAAAERSLTAGREFALVGFDDHSEARVRQLSTLRPPVEAMGQEASRLLLRGLEGEQTSVQIRLRWQLIPRASCAVPILKTVVRDS